MVALYGRVKLRVSTAPLCARGVFWWPEPTIASPDPRVCR